MGLERSRRGGSSVEHVDGWSGRMGPERSRCVGSGDEHVDGGSIHTDVCLVFRPQGGRESLTRGGEGAAGPGPQKQS